MARGSGADRDGLYGVGPGTSTGTSPPPGPGKVSGTSLVSAAEHLPDPCWPFGAVADVVRVVPGHCMQQLHRQPDGDADTDTGPDLVVGVLAGRPRTPSAWPARRRTRRARTRGCRPAGRVPSSGPSCARSDRTPARSPRSAECASSQPPPTLRLGPQLARRCSHGAAPLVRAHDCRSQDRTSARGQVGGRRGGASTEPALKAWASARAVAVALACGSASRSTRSNTLESVVARFARFASVAAGTRSVVARAKCLAETGRHCTETPHEPCCRI